MPRTAAQRRGEQIRRTCLSLLPLLLFGLATIPRVWAPDQAPFSAAHAATLTEARRLAAAFSEGVWWTVATADGPALLLAVLVWLPDPLAALVVVHGLLDALAAALVFVAARLLLGLGPAALATLLYAGSPWTWILARDPTIGGLTALSAGALLAAIACVRHPSLSRVLALSLVGGLLPRFEPTGWIFAVPLLATLLIAGVSRRLALVAAIAYLALAAPALAGLADRMRSGSADPVAALELAWRMAAGVGAEHRLVGGSVWPVLPEPLVMAALGCVALLLLLGELFTPELGRVSRAAMLPLLWVVLPLAALVVVPATEALIALLPAATVLMVLPLRRRGGRVAGVARRAGLAAGIAVTGLGVATLGGLAWQASASAGAARSYVDWTADAEARRHGSAAPGLGSATALPLRFWQEVASAALDAAERVGTRELLVVFSPGPAGDAAARLAALLGDRLAVRALPPGTLPLPLAREALYLVPPGAEPPGELDGPSSRLAAVPLPGTDARADLVSLRARPAAHWLTRATERPVHFADGSVLAGFGLRTDRHARPRLDLYWTFETASAAGLSGRAVDVIARGDGDVSGVVRADLPLPVDRRADELVLQRVAPELSSSGGAAVALSLTLVADDGARVSAGSVVGAPTRVLPLVSVPASVLAPEPTRAPAHQQSPGR